MVWLALRNAALALLMQIQPAAALTFWPPSGAALAGAALGRQLPPERLTAVAAEALSRDPLAQAPVLLAADAAIARGETDRATALSEAAVQRNSRDADARLQLFQLYFSDGRWSEAIDQGLMLSRHREAMRSGILETFLLLLDDIRGRAILARKARLRSDGSAPEWRRELVRLAEGRPQEAQLRRLFHGRQQQAGAAGGEPTPQSYQAWVASLPDETLAQVRSVYDGRFRGLPGAPPFNWTFTTGDSAQARIESGAADGGGVLVAERAAGGAPVLARQITVLPPGHYRLNIEGSASDAGAMAWQVSCLGGDVLGELALPAGSAPQPVEEVFAVPPGCAFQTLALVGASDRPAQSRTVSVSVHPAP